MYQVTLLLRAGAEHLPKEITIVVDESGVTELGAALNRESYVDFYVVRGVDGTHLYVDRGEVVHVVIREAKPAAPKPANDNAPAKPSDADWAALEAA